MVKMPRFETYCLETGVKTLVTETGQQLPPSLLTNGGYHAPVGYLYVGWKILLACQLIFYGYF